MATTVLVVEDEPSVQGTLCAFLHDHGFATLQAGTVEEVLKMLGMRDDEMFLLKLKWTTAHPIRSASDLARFMQPQELHSNR